MKQSYQEKLKNPLWQRKRLEIFNRDGWKCRNCGDDKNTLAVHHKKYITGRDPWDYEESNLITLCKKCHENYHKHEGLSNIEKYRKFRKYFYELHDGGNLVPHDAFESLYWEFANVETVSTKELLDDVLQMTGLNDEGDVSYIYLDFERIIKNFHITIGEVFND